MRRKIYQQFSFLLAVIILVTSFDMTAFASEAEMNEVLEVTETPEPSAEPKADSEMIPEEGTDLETEPETVVTYIVTFDANGGICDVNEKEVTSSAAYGELPVPTRANYSFAGWFTAIEGGEQIVSDAIVALTENQTLYAHWEAKYTVEMPTASIASETEVKAGTKVVLSTTTRGAKIYYTTDAEIGENVSAENGILVDGAIEIFAPITIYAVATKEDYKNSAVLTVSYTVTDESNEWGDITEEDKLEMGFITTADIPHDFWLTGVSDQDYCGKKITFPDIRVYHYKTLLVKDQDYAVKYTNNINVGKATITITGKGNYSGSIVRNFVINPLDIGSGTAENIVLTYNEKVQKGKTKVTFPLNGETVTLKSGTDFVYTYPGTDSSAADYDAGAFKEAREMPYTVVIVGKGNYTGTLTFEQKIIEKIVLSKVTAEEISARNYTGSEITPKVKLTYNKKRLVEGTDYTLTYSDNVKVGTAIITVTGMGNYEGTKVIRFKIKGKALSQASYTGLKSSVKYTGAPITQDAAYFYVGKKSNKLVENKDYQVEYRNNTEIGTATVIYTGMGGYTGTVKKTYRITGTSLEKVKVAAVAKQTYSGGEISPIPTVTYEGVELAGVEASAYETMLPEEKGQYAYTFSCAKNINAGKASIKIVGVNAFSGSLTRSFTIEAYDIRKDYLFAAEEEAFSNQKITVQLQPTYKYTKGSVTPEPVVRFLTADGDYEVLKKNKDYTLTYSGNAKQGTGTIEVTGKGNFVGTIKSTFTIEGASLADVTVQAKDVVYKKQTGNCKPVITITDTNGAKLVAGVDYNKTITYKYASDVCVKQFTDKKKKKTKTVVRMQDEEVNSKDIIPVGAEITAIISGKGNYSNSTTEVTFGYVKASIANASVKVATQSYTGSPVEPQKDDIKVVVNKTVLENSDYEIVGYRNNTLKGKGTVIIRGIGDYGGTTTAEFKIKTRSMNYIITYDKNAENATGTMKNASLPTGAKLTTNSYKRRGYAFAGWSTSPGGSDGVFYKNGEKFQLKSGMPIYGAKITLYAQWTPVEYKITYKLNGGTNHELNPKTYTIEDETITLQEPVREGYEFQGWYTDRAFSKNKKITAIAQGSTGNKTVYAKWKITVILDVEVPDSYLDVCDFGATKDDDTEDTEAFDKAIEQASANAQTGGINTVYVPAGTYVICPGDADNDPEPGISLKSNVNLVMDNDAILQVMGTSLSKYCVMSAKYVENITVTGGRIVGERYKHTGTYGEWGHGIGVYGGTNITISNMAISGNWGDGIYLGTQAVRQEDDSQLYVGCENIEIRNCEIFNNRRSNISITDADELLIERCLIYDAHGTAPQCGVYIEPNSNSSGDKICRGITIKDTTINPYKNKIDAEYMCFMTHYDPYNSKYVTADDIWFIDCVFNGYVGNYSGTNLHRQNTVIKGPFVNLK